MMLLVDLLNLFFVVSTSLLQLGLVFSDELLQPLFVFIALTFNGGGGFCTQRRLQIRRLLLGEVKLVL